MARKVSSYLQISNQTYVSETGERLRLVYATRTASMVCVPEAVAAALAAGRMDGLDREMVDNLAGIEAVVAEDELERRKVLDQQRAASRDEGARRFVLLPTTYCNMGCSYCGQAHTRGRLGQRHRDAVSARVLAGIDDPATRTVRVNWFGAEPMVAYPLVLAMSKQFIERAEANRIEYTSSMVTNGSLLDCDKLVRLRRDCRVTKLDITLDGPAQVHDLHRPLKKSRAPAAGGSFGHITCTVAAALRLDELADVLFVFRTNIDRSNLGSIDEYLDTMAGLGFATDQVAFNLAPVYSWGNDVSAIEVDRGEYAHREVEWMRRMLRLGLRFEAAPSATVGALCSAVSRSAEIHSSSGALFSCSEYPLVPAHEAAGGLGRISEISSRLRPAGPFDDWHDSVEAGQTPCHSCAFLPVCGGSCPKQWREGNRACPPYKYNFQDRFDLIAEMAGLVPSDGADRT